MCGKDDGVKIIDDFAEILRFLSIQNDDFVVKSQNKNDDFEKRDFA